MNKVKVAIPVFGSEVSPRYDCAPEIMIVEFENGEVASCSTVAMEGLNPLQRLNSMSASGIMYLVCGAVPGFYRRMMDSLGIKIIHAERIAIDVLIEHIKQGELTSMSSCGYGRCGKRRH